MRQAVREADLNTVDELLDSGVSINQQDEAGWTVLHWWNFSFYFAKGPFLGTLRHLIERGVDVNVVDTRGRTALMILLTPGDDQPQTSQLQAIRILADANSDLQKKDEWGESAMTLGLASRFTDIRAYFRKLSKSSPRE